MELILSIALGFCIAGLSFFIGTAAAGREATRLTKVNKELQTKITSMGVAEPMVIECHLGQQLTIDQMATDVVTVNLIKIWRHFGKGFDTMPSSTSLAHEMLQWYNPDSEYTKLVLVGYLHGDVIRLMWTWTKRDAKCTITRNAVEGLEKYYEDALGNPVILDTKV